jgi:tRNA threonylcarbamoyladenosine biosynthesis protein TsaB
MTILAFEFSSARRSVAVAQNRRVLAEVIETGAGATRAFGMIETALREAKLERGQVEAIAVGLGPGSYTGIRVALAVAQGWQLARGIKLLGVSSAGTIAAQAQAEKISGRVNVLIDAQRNEFYLATWEISETGRKETGPLRIVTLADIQSRPGEIFVGPEAARWIAGGRNLFPRAAMLAELAADRDDFTPGEKLQPIYLRETNFVKAAAPRAGLH